MSNKLKGIFKGRYVKEQVATDLFSALHEANLADVKSGDQVNDLPHNCSRQESLFGHLALAIKALGYEAEYNTYCNEGDLPDFSVPEEVAPRKTDVVFNEGGTGEYVLALKLDEAIKLLTIAASQLEAYSDNELVISTETGESVSLQSIKQFIFPE